MTEIFFLVWAFLYLIYRLVFVLPRDMKRLEGKVDNLRLHLCEIERRLDT